MKVLTKNSTELVILAMKSDTIRKGDYLSIEDGRLNRKMITQIYEEEYLSSQSLIEDIVRDEVISASSTENLHDPLNIAKLSKMIRDARLFRTKIRRTINRRDVDPIKGVFKSEAVKNCRIERISWKDWKLSY
jgi:hypothetical protein